MSMWRARELNRKVARDRDKHATEYWKSQAATLTAEVAWWREWWWEQEVVRNGGCDEDSGSNISNGSSDTENENVVNEPKVALGGEAAEVNDSFLKESKVERHCKKFGHKSVTKADSLNFDKNSREESQLEHNLEKSFKESVIESADVEAKQIVMETSGVEQRSKTIDKKRLVLQWTPEKPSTKTRRVWSSAKKEYNG
jgi:hypothetical protein